MSLESVAARISEDLKRVVFVGAFAVTCHIGPYRHTHDIDLAVAYQISDGELEGMGYRVLREGGKRVIRTEEGIKLDIYTKDVSGISIPFIFRTAVTKRIRSKEIKVICLEALLIAKMRAARPQDIEDVQMLCGRLGKTIRWDIVDLLATPIESAELRNVVSAYGG